MESIKIESRGDYVVPTTTSRPLDNGCGPSASGHPGLRTRRTLSITYRTRRKAPPSPICMVCLATGPPKQIGFNFRTFPKGPSVLWTSPWENRPRSRWDGEPIWVRPKKRACSSLEKKAGPASHHPVLYIKRNQGVRMDCLDWVNNSGTQDAKIGP